MIRVGPGVMIGFTFLLFCCQTFPYLCYTDNNQDDAGDSSNRPPAAARRLSKELLELKTPSLRLFRNIQVDESNIFKWQGLLVPGNPPYNKGAFKIEIDFPADYPFKPPKILFQTKIYHPNVDEEGQVYLPIINAEHWKPATKTDNVIQSLLALLYDPELEHPFRADLAEEYVKDRNKFIRNAEEFTKKYSEERPSD